MVGKVKFNWRDLVKVAKYHLWKQTEDKNPEEENDNSFVKDTNWEHIRAKLRRMRLTQDI